MLGLLLVVAVIGIIIAFVVANWKLFTKAGEKGWKSLIPIYSTYVKIKIAFSGSKKWLISEVILFFFAGTFGVNTTFVRFNIEFSKREAISSFFSNLLGVDSNVLGLIIFLIAMAISLYVSYNFILKYNTSTGMAILSLFFPIIIIPIVAFSNKYQYDTEYDTEYEYVEEE